MLPSMGRCLISCTPGRLIRHLLLLGTVCDLCGWNGLALRKQVYFRPAAVPTYRLVSHLEGEILVDIYRLLRYQRVSYY